MAGTFTKTSLHKKVRFITVNTDTTAGANHALQQWSLTQLIDEIVVVALLLFRSTCLRKLSLHFLWYSSTYVISLDLPFDSL